MFTLEQKVDLVMRYIASSRTQQSQLKKAIVEALNEDVGVIVPVDYSAEVTKMTVDILKDLGVAPHMLGYTYTLDAVRLIYSDSTYLKALTKRLYPAVAAKHNAKPYCIERAIRYTIEYMFDKGDLRNIHAIFGNTISVSKGKVTSRVFLSHITNELHRRMSEKE